MSSDTVRRGLRRTSLFGSLLFFYLWSAEAPQASWVSAGRPQILLLSATIGIVYFLVEVGAVKFRFGRLSQSVTIVEIPLMAGLLCLPPLAHVLVRIVGQALGTHIRVKKAKNKDAPWVLLTNASLGGSEVTVFSLLTARYGFRAVFDGHGLRVLAIAFVAMSLVTPIGWLFFHSEPGDRFPVKKVGMANIPVLELSFVFFSISILFLTLISSSVVAGALLMALLLALANPLRQYTKLSTRAEETANLFHFSDLLSRSRDATDMATILDHAAKTARGGESEIVLLNVRNMPADSVLSIRGEARTVQPRDTIAQEWSEILAEGESRIMRADRPWSEARTAMAAPLLVNGETIGLLVVSSHSDEFHNFKMEDVAILETLARHLGLWLEQDRLIDALEVEIEERHHDALRDPLTNLPNRSAFTTALNNLIEKQIPTSVLLLNLSHFKIVNEHYSHEAGDELLREIGERIQSLVPLNTLVARLGGDEFTICLPNVSTRQAELLAGTISRAFRQPFQIADDEVEIGASIGIAHYPTHGSDITLIMSSADAAMYLAKSTSDGIFTHERPKHTAGANSLARTVLLRRAIENFQIVPYYQPLVDLHTGKVAGFEALARWQVSEGNFVSPDEFIALAEDTHLIHELTVQIASNALADIAYWKQLPGLADLTVSVNISPVTLGRRDITEQLLLILSQLDLAPAALTLEITESRVMEDPARCLRHLRDLADVGLQLAIDDFGAGQTSLSYLAELPVHHLKIDRSFLLEAVENPKARRLMGTMIALGRDLDQTVTVEGIETADHWRLARDLGANKAQGYFVSKAMASSVTRQWLLNDAPRLVHNLGVFEQSSVVSLESLIRI